jgi:hypothetical protein
MNQAFGHETIDGAEDLNGQNPGDRMSVVGYDELVALSDPGEVLAQMVAKISNANLHRPSPLWLHRYMEL